MNIREQLLAGNNRFNIDIVAHHIGDDKKLFAELLKLTICGELPISMRAAWTMTACCDRHPEMAKPHLKTLIQFLPKAPHTGIIRLILRIIASVEVPVSFSGSIYHSCQEYLEDDKMPIAVKIFAMDIMYKISEKQPDLKPELLLLFEDLLVIASSPGVKNRCEKTISKLQKTINRVSY
jgi:hypothetical protein